MSETILRDETFGRYRRAARRRENTRRTRVEARRSRACDVARAAARLLYGDFAARRVILFGSLTRDSAFHERSDIDLAVMGIAPARFFAAWRAVDGLAEDFDIHLVDLERATGLLHQRIVETGIAL